MAGSLAQNFDWIQRVEGPRVSSGVLWAHLAQAHALKPQHFGFESFDYYLSSHTFTSSLLSAKSLCDCPIKQ